MLWGKSVLVVLGFCVDRTSSMSRPTAAAA